MMKNKVLLYIAIFLGTAIVFGLVYYVNQLKMEQDDV